MVDEDRIQQAEQFLFEEHQSRKPFTPIPASCAQRTLEEAYAVQEAFATLLAATQGPIAGYKIAFTTPVIQQLVGFHEPVTGFVPARAIHHSPCSLRCAEYVHLGMECEIAAQLGMVLQARGAPWSRDRVAEAVAVIMPAFELVDDRNADFTQLTAQVLTIVADNTWSAGIVLGRPVTDWRSLDLAAVRGRLNINGQVVGEGYGRDVMGHPLEALTWLANMFAARGQSLPAGTVILTGSITTPKFVHPGDVVHATVEGLGEVRLSVV